MQVQSCCFANLNQLLFNVLVAVSVGHLKLPNVTNNDVTLRRRQAGKKESIKIRRKRKRAIAGIELGLFAPKVTLYRRAIREQ